MSGGHKDEHELALLIIKCLNLEDVSPDAIDPEAPLFGDGPGLGLDSLDMLELSMAVEQKYGVKLRSDDPDNAKIFASLRNLAQHVHSWRTA